MLTTELGIYDKRFWKEQKDQLCHQQFSLIDDSGKNCVLPPLKLKNSAFYLTQCVYDTCFYKSQIHCFLEIN